jgi:hypothetical protein
MHERLRDSLLGAWGRGVASRPWITLILCLAVAAVSVVMTASKLEFRPDRSDLVDPELAWNKRYAQYKAQFPRWNDVIVVLAGSPTDRRIDDLARAIADSLSGESRIASADAGFDASAAGPSMFRAAPGERFDEAVIEIREAQKLASCENANAALQVLLAGLAGGEGDAQSLDHLERFVEPYLAAMSRTSPDFSFLKPGAPRWQPLISQSGSLRFIMVQFATEDSNGVNSLAANLPWLRQRVAGIVEHAGVKDVEFGVTGIPAIEADETAQSMRDSTVASILALSLITALMVLVFRGIIVPLLAAGALLIGIAWSFGWLIVSVGHLQVLSVVFTVMLLGLGVDFAVLLVSRLQLIQREHATLAEAMQRVFRGVGPGMITGTVTAAAAFASTAFTQFKGVAEMGIIAAGGIVLCLIAVLSAFPAAVAATGRWKTIIHPRPGGETAHFARGWLDSVDAHPIRTLILGAALIAALALSATRVSYDPNVLNLQSHGVESVQWEMRLVHDDARSAWSAMIVCPPDHEHVGRLVDRLAELPQTSGVGAMGMLAPPDRAQRDQRVAEMRQSPPPTIRSDPGLEATATQLAAVRAGLALRRGRPRHRRAAGCDQRADRRGSWRIEADQSAAAGGRVDVAQRLVHRGSRRDADSSGGGAGARTGRRGRVAAGPPRPLDRARRLVAAADVSRAGPGGPLDPRPGAPGGVRERRAGGVADGAGAAGADLRIQPHHRAGVCAGGVLRGGGDPRHSPAGLPQAGGFAVRDGAGDGRLHRGLRDHGRRRNPAEFCQHHRHAADLRHRRGGRRSHGPPLAGRARRPPGRSQRRHRPRHHPHRPDDHDRLRLHAHRRASRHPLAWIRHDRRPGRDAPGLLHAAAGDPLPAATTGARSPAPRRG